MAGFPAGRRRQDAPAVDEQHESIRARSSIARANVDPAAAPAAGRATNVAAGMSSHPRRRPQATQYTEAPATATNRVVAAAGDRESSLGIAGAASVSGRSVASHASALTGRKRARSIVGPGGIHGGSLSCSPRIPQGGAAPASRAVMSVKAARTHDEAPAAGQPTARSLKIVESRGKSNGDCGVLADPSYAVPQTSLWNLSVADRSRSGFLSTSSGQYNIGQSAHSSSNCNFGSHGKSQPPIDCRFPLSSPQTTTARLGGALHDRLTGRPKDTDLTFPLSEQGLFGNARIGTPVRSRHPARADGAGDDFDTSAGDSFAHRGRSACTPDRRTPVNHHTPMHEMKRFEAGPSPMRSASPFSTASRGSKLNQIFTSSPYRMSPVSGAVAVGHRIAFRERTSPSPYRQKDDETSEWPSSQRTKLATNLFAEEGFEVPESALNLTLSKECNALLDDFRRLCEVLYEFRVRNLPACLHTTLPKKTSVPINSILRILWMAPNIVAGEWSRDPNKSDSIVKQMDIEIILVKNPKLTTAFSPLQRNMLDFKILFHKILIAYTADFHHDFLVNRMGIAPNDFSAQRKHLPLLSKLTRWQHGFDPNKIRGCTELSLWKLPPRPGLKKKHIPPNRMNSDSPCCSQEPMGRAGRAPVSAMVSPSFGSPTKRAIGEYCGPEPVVDSMGESPLRGCGTSPHASRRSLRRDCIGSTLRSAVHGGAAVRERAPSPSHRDEAAAGRSGRQHSSPLSAEKMSAAGQKSSTMRDKVNANLPTLLQQRGLASHSHKPPNIQTADSSSLQKLHAHNIHPHRHRHDPADEPASALQKGRRRVSAFPVEQNDSIVAHQQARQCRSLSPFRTARNGGDSRPLDAEVSNPEFTRGLVVKHVLMHLLHDELKNSTSPKSLTLESFWRKHLENDKRHISLSECNKAMSEMMNRFPQAVKIEQCITNSAKNRVTCFPGVHFVKAVGQIAEEARSGNPMSNLSTRS
eukprot:GHVT01095909.1.p1 GENE.GHVT01095909.1~~GHVT01095909.1.p1  ORF type:complete len:976 (+),score=88.70 GHVT01095909.1:858-3785(+)